MSSGEVGTWLGLMAGLLGGAGVFTGGWVADSSGWGSGPSSSAG